MSAAKEQFETELGKETFEIDGGRLGVYLDTALAFCRKAEQAGRLAGMEEAAKIAEMSKVGGDWYSDRVLIQAVAAAIREQIAKP